MTCVGVDIGGTRTKAVVVSTDGEVTEAATVATPPRVAQAVADHVADVLDALGNPDGPLGVVVPGLVDDAQGVALWSANLGFRDAPLAATLAARWPGRTVTVGHDVRAGLVAEHAWGAAHGHADVLFVALGTGIAGATLAGGRLLAASPYAGELGHVVVDPAGPPCGCGARGCLEMLASGRALGERWVARGGRGTAVDLARAAAGGDARALELLGSAAAALGVVLAPALASCGADLLVVGGGLANAGDVLLDPLREAVRARVPLSPVEIRPALLGERAGALGAARLAMERAR